MKIILRITLLIYLVVLANNSYAITNDEIIQNQDQELYRNIQTLEREKEIYDYEKSIENQKKLESLTPQLLPKIKLDKSSVSRCIKIKGVDLTNSEVFSKKKINKIIKKSVGKCVNANNLQALTRLITNFYIKKGYSTSRAFITPHNVKDGIVKIYILEGKIESIEFENDRKL